MNEISDLAVFFYFVYFVSVNKRKKKSFLMINFRSGTLTDLIRSAPSLPLWKCLGYFLLVAFGIELLVGIFPVRGMFLLQHTDAVFL